MGDVALGGLFVLVISTLAGIAAVLVALFTTDAVDPSVGPDRQMGALVAAPAVIAISLLGQQLAQGAWPWIVARWKGRSLARDFGVRFRWSDLWIGPLCGLGLLIAASVVGALLTRVVGLENAEEASNTDIITAGGASAWSLVVYACVVLGAPISEEMFFRGLVLRAVRKRAGNVMGVAASTLLFTVVHVQSTSAAGLTVLLGSIAAVGLILGVMAVRFDRLGPSILAHATLNGVAVLAALSA